MVKRILFSLLVLIAPLLVLGDVHLAHQDHSCELEQQSSTEDLLWHPHGACASDVEKEHFDLKSLARKSSDINDYELPAVPCEALLHNHSECQQATQIADHSGYFAENMLNALSVYLI